MYTAWYSPGPERVRGTMEHVVDILIVQSTYQWIAMWKSSSLCSASQRSVSTAHRE